MRKNHIAKKRFGQNFLTDQAVIAHIIRIINPQAVDNMLEIGPGLGALTYPLLEKLDQLQVIEIDRDIIQFLINKKIDKLLINSCDALKFDYATLGDNLRIVGNLPYNISTPLLFHLSSFNNIKDMHFMLQKEVVDRICASPNSHEYGRLSIMLQYKFNCTHMLDVDNSAFHPKPQVQSAIIRLKPLAISYNVDEKKLGQIVTTAFNQRRKTIGNSLKNLVSLDIFEKLAIDPKKRAENLTIDEYVKITCELMPI